MDRLDDRRVDQRLKLSGRKSKPLWIRSSSSARSNASAMCRASATFGFDVGRPRTRLGEVPPRRARGDRVGGGEQRHVGPARPALGRAATRRVPTGRSGAAAPSRRRRKHGDAQVRWGPTGTLCRVRSSSSALTCPAALSPPRLPAPSVSLLPRLLRSSVAATVLAPGNHVDTPIPQSPQAATARVTRRSAVSTERPRTSTGAVLRCQGGGSRGRDRRGRAVVAIDHGQAGAHIAGELEGRDAGTKAKVAKVCLRS